MTESVELLTVWEFVKLHSDKHGNPRMSADLVRDMVGRGELPSVRAGTKKILIPADALWRMFEEQDAQRKQRAGTESGTG